MCRERAQFTRHSFSVDQFSYCGSDVEDIVQYGVISFERHRYALICTFSDDFREWATSVNLFSGRGFNCCPEIACEKKIPHAVTHVMTA